MTPSQLSTLRTWLDANAANLNDEQARDALNAQASPNYWVWRTDMSRATIYNESGDGGSSWDWTTYKNQSVTEQNAWVQMFMGDITNFGKLNVRSGVSKIFTGSAQANAQRDHCFAVSRRTATVAEKLLSIAVLSPPANTGNDVGQPRGSTANPDILTHEGLVTTQDVVDARR